MPTTSVKTATELMMLASRTPETWMSAWRVITPMTMPLSQWDEAGISKTWPAMRAMTWSTVGTTITRKQTEIQPTSQPQAGPARRVSHW